jgi:uncharacterized delta-60 repeat protein
VRKLLALTSALGLCCVTFSAIGSSNASGREGRASSVDFAYALAVERDGKLVVGGVSRRACALARYTVRGRLDRRFGAAGRVLTRGLDGPARAIAVQADGKIVVTGCTDPRRRLSGFELARFTTGGRLDPSFGRNGKVVTHFGSRRNVSGAGALAIQPDGKIVAVGSWSRALHDPGRFALARYTPRGRLDSNFGHGGRVVTSFGRRSDASAVGVLIRQDGRLVVVGTDVTELGPKGYSAVALARYHADGTLDRSFGGGGRVVSKLFEYGASASAAVLRRDGKVVVDANDTVRSFLVRYTVDGKLDSSFGHGGKAAASRRVLPLLALQRGGKLIVAGSHFGSWLVHRYRPNGDVDSCFGRPIRGGKRGQVTYFRHGGRADAVAVQANGKIVVAGTRGFTDFALVPFTSRGRLDRSFGRGGKVTTDFSSVWRTRRRGR